MLLFTFIPPYSAACLLKPTVLSSKPRVVLSNIKAIIITAAIAMNIPIFIYFLYARIILRRYYQ